MEQKMKEDKMRRTVDDDEFKKVRDFKTQATSPIDIEFDAPIKVKAPSPKKSSRKPTPKDSPEDEDKI